MSFKEKLPTRIPEYLQDDNELQQYLEAAGELLDEFKAAIESLDKYDDYQDAPEARLSKLAREFAMTFPRNLNVELQRAIIRDLEEIYQKTGTVDVVNWIFRLIGWDVSLEYAWVLNPERYDPKVKQVFSLDDYDGEKTQEIMTDFYRNDYRNFLIGEEYIRSNGTYFRGRRFFDLEDTFLQNEIVGEVYDQKTKTRTPDKVMKTPYLFIRVSEETYNIFIQPYVDETTGEVYEYTEVEFFNVVENIFNFFLYDAFRPSNVRVVIVVTAHILDDKMTVSETYEDSYVSEPVDMPEKVIMHDTEESKLIHTLRAGNKFLAGAPPSPFNKDMVLSSIQRSNLSTEDYEKDYVTADGVKFVVEGRATHPVARCGTDTFEFTTPHEEEFSFRRVFSSEVSSLDLVSGIFEPLIPYEGDLNTLSFCVDFISGSYGINEPLEDQGIIIRNPTTITSLNFSPEVIPSNAYYVGSPIPEGGYEKNKLFGFDVRESDTAETELGFKTFIYDYDMTVYGKENNLQENWEPIITNPVDGDLNRLTKYNAIILSFNKPIPYDFVIDINYEAQEHWENRYAS